MTRFVDLGPSDLKYRVYVIELDPKVSLQTKWKDENPNQTEQECFYVGYSRHSAVCRLKQHLNSTGIHTVQCVCDVVPGEPVGSRGNRYVKRFGWHIADDSFHPKLRRFRTKDEAKRAEVDYANLLRSEGYGAWQK